MIDKGMTKTEMRMAADISGKILAKMGKGEPIAMESLAKIATALDCGLDDIVEIVKSPSNFEIKKYGISDATAKNWGKLKTSSTGRLTERANKRKSQKRVLPLEYIRNKNNVAFLQNTLDFIDEKNADITSVILSLGINLLKRAGILDKEHVASVIDEYSDVSVIDEFTTAVIPDDEFDLLGLVYQSFLQEGKKNIKGSYYTPPKIARNMTKDFDFSRGECFLDPCCGGGSFLLSATVENPAQLFGADNDAIAVLICKINLLLKYRDVAFLPQIYCLDYLMGNSVIQQSPIFDKKFDYIATNPPWGAMSAEFCHIPEISSKETFSYFFVKAFEQLAENGTIRFLFPESILNVKVHKDIRQFILDAAGLASITAYDDSFSGVATRYVDIECGIKANKRFFYVYSGDDARQVDLDTLYETDNLIFNLLTEEDISIIRTVKRKGAYSLQNSAWALGVVTGDNKKKLHPTCLEGMEKIYTGKEIQPYRLKEVQNYIFYDRANLQQVAREEIYRAPEKLVYKFISNRLTFAYDDSSSLFLNSANILIPAIPFMGVKTVMAFLNSSLFQFMYSKLFGEVKTLKGNLIELPFPQITEAENDEISALVDDVLNGSTSTQRVIDDYIFSIYGLSNEQKKYVRRIANGKAD